jgi:hypothetical protein
MRLPRRGRAHVVDAQVDGRGGRRGSRVAHHRRAGTGVHQRRHRAAMDHAGFRIADLEDIRQWLELYDADPEGSVQRDAWLALADRQLDELKARRVELDEIISELKALRDNTATGER